MRVSVPASEPDALRSAAWTASPAASASQRGGAQRCDLARALAPARAAMPDVEPDHPEAPYGANSDLDPRGPPPLFP